MPPETVLDPIALLRWYAEMGVDEAIGAEPVDRFALAAQGSRASERVAPPPHPQGERGDQAAQAVRNSPSPLAGEGGAAPAAPGEGSPHASIPTRPRTAADLPLPGGGRLGEAAVDDAKACAAQCQSLEEIAAALARFDACPLKKTATYLVFADGNPLARLLVIGEAPGRDEDLAGKPFVGRSGQLLDRMLQAIGLARHDADPARAALISNMIFWRPPGNRKPTEAETLMCLPFIERTIELANPRLLVLLGGTAAARLLRTTEGIMKLRGRRLDYRGPDGRNVPTIATLHPAYLLRTPAHKRLAWRDLLEIRKMLDAHRA
jgi:uracil-DNA glycosylase family 4